MKRILFVTLTLVIVLGTFTGCEPAPTLYELLTTVESYNDELFALVVPRVQDYDGSGYSEGDFITIDEGITCIVDTANSDELNLSLTLDNWRARNGTKISGTIVLDIEYFTSPSYSINMMRTAGGFLTSLHFERTSVSYVAQWIDNDYNTGFDPEYENFFCTSMIEDGKILILNSYGFY